MISISQIKKIIKQFWVKYSCKHHKPNVKINILSFIGENSVFEGMNVINKGTVFSGYIGYGSFIGPHSHLQQTKVGRFCSIASHVKVISGRHPTSKFVSTHPAFYSLLKQSGDTFVDKQKYEEFQYVDLEERILVDIGNDVWIGEDVRILEGIKIGDGAIVAAGSVVTKDIEPYVIVGGIPAKQIRKRFDESQIESLLSIAWWNKPIEWIRKNADLFENVDTFILTLRDHEQSNK